MYLRTYRMAPSVQKFLLRKYSPTAFAQGETWQDRLKILTDSLAKIKSFIATKPAIELPPETVEKLKGAAKAAAPAIPIILIGGLVAVLVFGGKKKAPARAR